jgi:hypothetical protein
VLGEAQRRGAKVILVGDPEQLQAIEAGAAFRSIAERHTHVEIKEIRRQREGWQQDATRHLATGRTGEALDAYSAHGMVHAAQTRDSARGELIDGWDRDRSVAPDKTRIILTHTNEEVLALNNLARAKLREAGALGEDIGVAVERGDHIFASGDRVMFLKNDRGLGIKNGSLGVIETVNTKHMTVRLDASRSVTFDLKDYADLDHGYAATIHKAQGVTVDRVHVLATPGLDRHAAYVALSRHRDGVQLYYGRDDFTDNTKLARVLSRERAKDMASDYERDGAALDGGKTDRQPQKAPDKAPQTQRSNEPGIFASFRPKPASLEPNMPATDSERASDQQVAIQRYAQSALDIARMQEQELPILAHQRQAQDRARAALDAIRPHAARDLDSAFDRDATLLRDAANGCTPRVIRAMQVEAELRNDPKLRADRFVERWQNLDRQRGRFERGSDWLGEHKARASMGAMAKNLERDPQMESLLKTRSRELGLPMATGRGIGHGLVEYLGLSRGRGMGL